ncbi:DinB family protein [Fodinibius salsisoli]|uniref:DinB family protein n=1 Tax=Fodinibius salsisoli TaxID=2820877 RepID=A0ABT3PIB1_9BACT|nr:DinB family protein [Fodinibius salsisoli]MCW9705644.1 DinB family protein [Fodinibius salsisoli]
MKCSHLDLISKRLTLIYNGDAWYGPSIEETLTSFNGDYIFDSPKEGRHSIGELVAHMLAWREFAERRLQNDQSYLPKQEETFNWQRFADNRKKAWGAMLDQLDMSQQMLLRLLGDYDDSILKEKVAGKPYSFSYLLNGIIQHDIYHLGQIVYLQKMLTQGVDDCPDITLMGYDHDIFPFEHLALQK